MATAAPARGIARGGKGAAAASPGSSAGFVRRPRRSTCCATVRHYFPNVKCEPLIDERFLIMVRYGSKLWCLSSASGSCMNPEGIFMSRPLILRNCSVYFERAHEARYFRDYRKLISLRQNATEMMVPLVTATLPLAKQNETLLAP